MRSILTARVLVALSVLWVLSIALVALAAVPSETGVKNQLTPVPATLRGYGNSTIPNNAAVGARFDPSNVPSLSFNHAFLGTTHATGGTYGHGSSQTAYGPYMADHIQRGRGQGVGYLGAVLGLGKGNALWANGIVDCYQGGEQPIPDSTSECAGLGEFEADAGDKIFSGVLASYTGGSTTITYATPVNERYAGARLLLNGSRTYSTGSPSVFTTCAAGVDITLGGTGAGNSVCPAQCPNGTGTPCTVVDFTGSTIPTANPSNRWYFKTGHTADNYTGACQGQDVSFANNGTQKCIGHWYKVDNVQSATRITLSGNFDTINLGKYVGGAYMLTEGTEALDVNNTTVVSPNGLAARSFRFPANSFAWANGDALYSPPSHYQGVLGLNLIFRKSYLTGASSAQSYGARIVNYGPAKMDDGIFISGQTGGGFSSGGFRNGVTVNDLGRDLDAVAGTTFNNTRAFNVIGDVDMLIAQNKDGDPATGKNCMHLGLNGDNLVCGTTSALVITGNDFKVDRGVHRDGGGWKHAIVEDTASLAASTRRDETVTWTTAFIGTGYTPVCTVTELSGYITVVGIKSKAVGSMTVTVQNTDSGGAHGGAGADKIQLNCQALYPEQ
jgi:hypothetical protein